MILVIFGVSIGLILLGVYLIEACNSEIRSGASLAFGIFGLIASLIVLVILIVCVTNLNVIDDKIAMYQEENTKIEEQIAEIVKQYQQYETDIFTEVSPDSSITLVALYPELKSDTLVQSQIDVYVKNNEKIKSLKENKISGSVYRWWLYFGG